MCEESSGGTRACNGAGEMAAMARIRLLFFTVSLSVSLTHRVGRLWRRGERETGKVVYFSFLLFFFLVRGFDLKGCSAELKVHDGHSAMGRRAALDASNPTRAPPRIHSPGRKQYSWPIRLPAVSDSDTERRY